ncbi:Hemolysin ahh1 [Frankliniella fusca]|uniref:Hemolysin ahh1 n=1 Tax=Frankliniella fusca TaxID=407009 RepID=A0AAE1HDR8_9NEOP|nr:Hemolysin ahh1 [Frankliniella fusca]
MCSPNFNFGGVQLGPSETWCCECTFRVKDETEIRKGSGNSGRLVQGPASAFSLFQCKWHLTLNAEPPWLRAELFCLVERVNLERFLQDIFPVIDYCNCKPH